MSICIFRLTDMCIEFGISETRAPALFILGAGTDWIHVWRYSYEVAPFRCAIPREVVWYGGSEPST